MNSYTTGAPVREIIYGGYGSMVKERLEQGWEGYLISFMFSQIRGSRSSVIHQMGREVERVYATVLTRIIRDPRKLPTAALPDRVSGLSGPEARQAREAKPPR